MNVTNQMVDRSEAVADCISWLGSSGLVVLSGDQIEEGQWNDVNAPACSTEQWNRFSNVMLGPRSTMTNGSACNGLCVCGDGTLNVDFIDLTSLNDGTLGFLSVNKSVLLAACQGNHDEPLRTSFSPTRSTSYNEMLGPSFQTANYGDRLLGFTRNGDTGAANMAWLTDLGGRRTLVISLACGPDQATLDWAVALLRARRHQPAILIHHIQLVESGDNADLTIAEDTDLDNESAIVCGSSPAGTVQTLILNQTTNVRMTFSGHYSSLIAGLSGEVGTSTDASSNTVLRAQANWQGIGPTGGVNGCYRRLEWNAGAVTITTYGDATRGPDCATPVAAAEFDQERNDATIALPFDPAPCNMLVTERAEATRRTFGCG